MANNLPQPPRNKGGQTDPLEISRWFDDIWKYLEKVVGIAWGAIDFTGSSLSDLDSRPHSDLQGTSVLGVHPHEAITGLDGPSVHPHNSIYGRDAANQHHIKAINFEPTAVTATYTINDSDFLVLADASGGDFTVTLLPAASAVNRLCDVKNSGATGTVTVDGDGTETIDGDLTFALIPYETITLLSDGTDWWII